jgi:hypothetical protein
VSGSGTDRNHYEWGIGEVLRIPCPAIIHGHAGYSTPQAARLKSNIEVVMNEAK